MRVLAKSLPFGVLLCAAIYLFTRTQQFDFPRTPGRLGPDIWPQAILVLLMVACAGGIVRTLLLDGHARSRREPGKGSETFPGEIEAEDSEAPPRYSLVAGGVLLFLAYPVALDHLGFLVATFLLMALFMLIGGWRNFVGVFTVSAAGTLALFYIFRGVVYVSLPLGAGVFHDWTVWISSLLGMR